MNIYKAAKFLMWLCIIFVILWMISRSPESTLVMFSQCNPILVLASVFLAVVGLGLLASAVAVNLAVLGYRRPLWHVTEAFLLSQPGKYVPGKALLAVIRCDLYQQIGIPVKLGLISLALETALNLVSVACIVLIAIPWLPWFKASSVSVVCAGILGILSIALLPSVLRKACRHLKCDVESLAEIQARTSLYNLCRVIFIGIAGWLAIGLAFAVLYLSFSAIPDEQFVSVLVAYPVAAIVGFLIILAPAGLGVRELTLAGFLSSEMDVTQAASIAVLARLWWVLVELSCAAFAAIIRRVRLK